MNITVRKIPKPILKADIAYFRLFSGDSLWAYHPVVIKKQKTYYMFYTGKSVNRGIQHHALMAKSNDLYAWKKMKTRPISEGGGNAWDSDFIAHGFVYKEGHRYVMLYDGSRRGNWLEEIGLARSKDLIHWDKHSHNPIFKVGNAWWEKRHVSRCCLYKNKDIYFLYYAGHDGKRERIGLATSKNIQEFTTRYIEPILDVGERGSWDEKSISDPRVISFQNHYLMFYNGIDMKGVERTGLATSLDLIHWKKYEENPILDVSRDGWDKISSSRAYPFVEDGNIFLFYSGRKKYFYNIGLALVDISF